MRLPMLLQVTPLGHVRAQRGPTDYALADPAGGGPAGIQSAMGGLQIDRMSASD